jgi:ribosomal protein S18 acetylase RimI-like enzyme
MPLPILQPHSDPGEGDLLRYRARAELHWTRHLAEEVTLDVGTAFANPELAGVYSANCVMDAALPDGTSPEQAMAEVTAHFAAAGTRCWKWVMNPAAPAQRTQPLCDHLLAAGYVREAEDVMYLKSYPSEAIREVGDLKIIPARASFRHMRALAEEGAKDWSAPDLADATMMHLDDSHTDALVAIRGGIAAAYVAVLSVGEIGAIQVLYVSAPFRGQGIGRTMMSRALEICARSLFKHVFLCVAPENAPAIALYQRCGFQRIGQAISFRSPMEAA